MAEKNTQMVNGDLPHSAFVDHLASYPLVSSGIATYKSNPLGAHTVILSNRLYERFLYPLLASPFAQDRVKPAVSPYLSRADSLGDSSLSTIDAHLPVLKSKPEEIQGQVLALIKAPFVFADKERQYVVGIYDDQYKKLGGNEQGGLHIAGWNVFAAGKALIGTGLVTTSETLSVVAGWLAQKKKEAQTEVKAKTESS